MEFKRSSLKNFILCLEAEESRCVRDEELGYVFYPCSDSIEEALEKSMA